MNFTGERTIGRKPKVSVQGRSVVGRPQGNSNGNKEEGIHAEPFQRWSQPDLESSQMGSGRVGGGGEGVEEMTLVPGSPSWEPR